MNAVEKTLWYIWSNEHKAWWGPNKSGYFTHLLQAGHYTYDEARKIISDSNVMLEVTNVPDETMFPVKYLMETKT